MSVMYIIFSIILPISLIGLVFCMPRILEWLNAYSAQKNAQLELIEAYERSTLRFLRETSDESHPILRDMIVKSGSLMMQGAALVEGFFFVAKSQNTTEETGKDKDAISKEFESLSEEARKAFSSATAMSLLISCHQSTFKASKYISMLNLVLTEKHDRLKEPQQLVYRFEQRKISRLRSIEAA